VTSHRADIQITSDLAALAEDSRRDPVPLAACDGAAGASVPMTGGAALRRGAAGVYRDDRPGAEARRDALAEERRRELATLPLALAHVFAHRIGRAAAGAVAVVSALAIALVLADPLLIRIAAWVIPGLNVSLLVALAGVAVLAAYVIGGWIGERLFERRMRQAITTSGDAYADLDLLASGPVDVARATVRRVDRWSVMLAIAGAVTLVPVVGFLLFTMSVAYPYPMMWANLATVANGPVGAGLGAVVVVTVFSLGGAVAVGRACDGELRRGGLPRWTAVLAHWGMIPLGIVLGLVADYGAISLLDDYHVAGIRPASGEVLVLAALGVAGIFAIATWAVLFWRRREHRRLGL
jgi:hypothetical protein